MSTRLRSVSVPVAMFTALTLSACSKNENGSTSKSTSSTQSTSSASVKGRVVKSSNGKFEVVVPPGYKQIAETKSDVDGFTTVLSLKPTSSGKETINLLSDKSITNFALEEEAGDDDLLRQAMEQQFKGPRTKNFRSESVSIDGTQGVIGKFEETSNGITLYSTLLMTFKGTHEYSSIFIADSKASAAKTTKALEAVIKSWKWIK